MAVTTTTSKFSVWRGTKAQYESTSLAKSADTLYFCTDSNLAFRGQNPVGTQYIDATSGFPTTGYKQGVLYVGPNFEVRFCTGESGSAPTWLVVTKPITEQITTTTAAEHNMVATAKAVKTYVDTVAAGMGKLRVAVADIAALKLETVVQTDDKDLILVENKGALYRYDFQSTETADDDKVVAPSTGSGRWLKMIVADTNKLDKTDVPLRANGTAYVVNDRVLYPGKYSWVLKCTTAGTTGTTLPAWPTSITSGTTTITDGTVTWTVIDLTATADVSTKMDKTDVPVLVISTAYAADARVLYPGKYGYLLVCTTGGSTDTTLPAWPATVESGVTTLTAGTAVFTIFDMALNVIYWTEGV